MEGSATSATGIADVRDAALVERARRGDVVAFETLIDARVDVLYRSAWAILGNEPDARDATQDACLSAWRNLPRLREIDRFDAWLGRVLVNTCRSLLRRRVQVREIPMARDVDAAHPIALDRAVEDADTLARAFDRLSADERAVLVLHHLRHLSVAAIATTLDIPVGTVKWRLHAARQSLDYALERERR
jgi:RNA polymerase sigma-70 factor, ECF subfamily